MKIINRVRGKIMNRKIIIIIVTAIVVIAGGLGIYRYNNIKAYNKLVNSANQYMEKGKYDQSLALFEESLSYKNDVKVKKSIDLAKQLKEANEIYNNGIKFMDEKKYARAINEFEKINKEDDKIYEEAKKKIEECKKVKGASDKNINKENENKASGKITPQGACDIIKNQIKSNNANIKFKYDHDDTKDGIKYYVIQGFEDMSDHVATIGWYYVDINTGKAYEWDLIANSLIPLK
jgi:tetratricopeptide (TPR) repeat protein